MHDFRAALESIGQLTESLDLTDYASRIIHPIVRTLDTAPGLRTTAMDTLAALVKQLGKKYTIFIPMVNKVLQKHRLTHDRYDVLMCKIIKVGELSACGRCVLNVGVPMYVFFSSVSAIGAYRQVLEMFAGCFSNLHIHICCPLLIASVFHSHWSTSHG